MKPGHPFESPDQMWHHGPWFWHHYEPFHELVLPSWAAVLAFVAGMAVYFLPTIVAYWRRHHNRLAIGILNLLLGWTLLGWAVALVWAATVVRRPNDRPG